MGTEQAIWRETFEAAEDLSDYQFHFVILGSSGARLPDAEDEVSIGILQNAPESGEAAEVMIVGKSKLVANAALPLASLLSPNMWVQRMLARETMPAPGGIRHGAWW